VLYLQVVNGGVDLLLENDDMKRMGPTIVFPSRQVAWGSVSPRTTTTQDDDDGGVPEYIVDVENYWDDETKRQYFMSEGVDTNNKGGSSNNNNNNNNNMEKKEEMAIVPALNGRLLRFDGRAFHAVPKPPHRYLMNEEELTLYLKQEEGECGGDDDDDEYWDHYDDEEDEEEDISNQRSVLLFNTWPASSGGPRGVKPDCIVDTMPDGIAIDIDNDGSDGSDGGDNSYTLYQNQMEEDRWSSWKDEYGEEFQSMLCNPINAWKSVSVESTTSTAVSLSSPSTLSTEEEGEVAAASSSSSRTTKINVSLMGNPSRRGCLQTLDVLNSRHAHGVNKKMFYESERVSLVKLQQSQK
jgi:hypothetical protein